MDKESFVNICNNLVKKSQFSFSHNFNIMQSEGKGKNKVKVGSYV